MKKSKKILRLNESQLKNLIKNIVLEYQSSMDEFDYRRMKEDDDMQQLRDAIDKNITVSVAFVKKDGTVRPMAIRKYLKSYVPSDKEKTDLQKNVEANNDIKRVIDINAYKRKLKELRDIHVDDPDHDVDMLKQEAAKSAWRSINLKNVLGFLVRGNFIDLRDENDIMDRFGEEVYNSLTRSMRNAMEINQQENDANDE